MKLLEEKKLPLWIESFFKSWPLLVFGAGLVWAAISRDMAQEQRLNNLDKYGTDASRVSMETQNALNQELVKGMALLNQAMQSQDKRIDRLEQQRQ